MNGSGGADTGGGATLRIAACDLEEDGPRKITEAVIDKITKPAMRRRLVGREARTRNAKAFLRATRAFGIN